MTILDSFEKKIGKEWTLLLKDFLLSEEYEKIGKSLAIQKNSNLSPDKKNIFRPFKECAYYNLNLVILADYPYTLVENGRKFADGLALSAGNIKRCPLYLNEVLTVIDSTIYNNKQFTLSDKFSLESWAKQGVLLLNAVMTTTIGKKFNPLEKNIWDNFIMYLLTKLNNHKDSVAFIFLGTSTFKYYKYINNPTCETFFCESPIEAMNAKTVWNHKNVFKRAHDFIKEKNNVVIKW